MTMYRYMAFMWNYTDQEAVAVATFLAAQLAEVSPHSWNPAWAGAGLSIYHSGEHKGRMESHRLAGERGVVLGQLFRNDSSSAVSNLDEFDSRRCLETKGQHLIDEYWGRYVAFLKHPITGGALYVMRDPSGAFPCLHTNYRGVTIFFSDMQDAANFPFLPFTVNWDYVRLNVQQPKFQKTFTALNEVQEVLPAQCIEIASYDWKSRFVWDPRSISRSDIIADADIAATTLRTTIFNTVRALSGNCDQIIHFLGGLDSSIILASLVFGEKNEPDINCITQFTRSPKGDERRYSRQAAANYGVSLFENELDHRKVSLERIFSINKSINPTGIMQTMDLTRADQALAAQHNADAFFTGVGGDNVLYQAPLIYGALDFVHQHGLTDQKSLRIALEASRFGRKSLLNTLREMISERFARNDCDKYIFNWMDDHRKLPFVGQEVTMDSSYKNYLHPLLLPRASDLKGKSLQILTSAFNCPGFYDCWDTEYTAERIHPFLTQPVVEACLRIPIWILTYGGVDRGLARKAFWNDLPSGVANRYSKSTTSEFYAAIFENYSSFFREILLDGELVGRGILDRSKIEKALNKNDEVGHVRHSDFLAYACTESWVRSWRERATRNAQSVRKFG